MVEVVSAVVVVVSAVVVVGVVVVGVVDVVPVDGAVLGVVVPPGAPPSELSGGAGRLDGVVGVVVDGGGTNLIVTAVLGSVGRGGVAGSNDRARGRCTGGTHAMPTNDNTSVTK